MIKLILKSNGDNSLIRSHNSFKGLGVVDMSMVIKDNIRQGTTIKVISDNVKPKPHRGDYYLLYMQEYMSVYLFYLDTQGVLRIVYSGDIENAVEAIYRFVSTDSSVTILKSDGKRAYRVGEQAVDGEYKFVSATYKNKSSQVVPQVYMNFFEAINLSVSLYKKNKKPYFVVSPKGTVMFSIPVK